MDNKIEYEPLYVHNFLLPQNSKQLSAGIFLDCNPDFQELTCVGEKLRWLRFKYGLQMKEVAEYVGIGRDTYARYEELPIEYYPVEVMKKIAEFYKVDVTELLDEYNMFIYTGQGKNLRAHRKKMKMTQSEYAKYLGVSIYALKQWEINRFNMKKKSWEKWVNKTRK